MKFYSVTKTQWNSEDYVLFFEQDCSINPTNHETLFVSKDKMEVEDFFNSLNKCEDDMYTEYTMYESYNFDEDDEDALEILDAIESKYYKNLTQFLYHNDIETKDFDVEVAKIAPKAVIVKWSWQTYVGYCRECIEIDFAENFDIEDERGLCTGNSDRCYRPNFSVLIDDAEQYNDKDELYNVLLERLVDNWKWNNNAQSKLKNFIDFRY